MIFGPLTKALAAEADKWMHKHQGLYFHKVTSILFSETPYNRTPCSIVRRMEVVCENKSFTEAGMLCLSELGTLGPRRSGK